MGLARLVAKGLVWTSLESFALSGISLISLVVFARFLSAEQFGVVAVALAIVQGLSVPVDMLFHDALIQRKELEPIHVNSAFSVSVFLGVTFCAACWLCAGLVERMVGQPHLAEVLRWMSLSLPGTGFGSVLIAMQRRRLEFRSLAVRSLSGRVGSALVALPLAYFGGGVWSLVVQQVLLVNLGTLTLWMLSGNRPRFQLRWPETRSLISFGWLSTSYHVVGILSPRIFMVLAGGYLGSKAAGLLSLAFRGLDMLRDLLVGALSQIAVPMFSRIRDDRPALYGAYSRSVQLTTLVTYPIFTGLALTAQETLQVVFGKQWLAAWPYFVLIALLTLPFFLRLYPPALLTALGHPAPFVVIQLIEFAYLVLAMVTFGRLSPTLTMVAWASRLVVSVPIDVWLLRRISGMSFSAQLSSALTPAAAAFGMACVVLLAKHLFLNALSPELRLLPIGLIGAASYVLILMLLDRQLVKQFMAFVGQSIQTRS